MSGSPASAPDPPCSGADSLDSTGDRSRAPPAGSRGVLESLPWVTGVAAAALTLLIALALAGNERARLDESLRLEAATYATAIEARVAARLAALERMAARWERRGGTPRDEWEADASLRISHDPAFETLAWVGPEEEIRWVVPEEADRRRLGALATPAGRAALAAADEADSPILSGPVAVGDGTTVLLGVAPLALDGLPGGRLVAVLPAERLFTAIAPDAPDEAHALEILHEGRALVRHGTVSDRQRPWAADATADVAGAAFTTRIWPTEQRIDDSSTGLPFVVLGFGLAASLLLVLAMRSSALHRARTAEVQLSNRALANQVDERRRAMQDVERVRDTLASIVDAADEGIIAVEGDGQVVFWNAVTERIFGRVADIERLAEGEGVFGPDGVTELTHDDLPVVRAFRGEPVDDFVFRMRGDRHPDGLWIAMSARPLRERDGTPRGAVAVFRDVTDRRRTDAARTRREAELHRAARELAAARAELKRSNEELEQFAHVASHDLQEPLRTVVSFTELLADRYRGELDEEADEFIGFIVGGALRMQRQIRDLLAYSRLQSRGRALDRVDLGEALDAALDRLSDLLEDSGAEIERRPLPAVAGDHAQLVVLFENLVENAVTFSRDATPRPRVRIGAGWDEREAVVWVADNGRGLDPRYADRIFRIFQRLGGGAEEGTGIGLAICRRVVERHGGRIWVESKPGEGARFVFTLRVASPGDTKGAPDEPAVAMEFADSATA